MESTLRISTTIVVIFVASPYLLAVAQNIVPGIYGDEEWLASPTFDMNTDSFWVVVNTPMSSNGWCTQDVTYGGQHTFDSIKLACSTIPVVDAVTNMMIVGNRIYSNKSGSVVFVTPEHTCIEKTYVMDESVRLKINQKALSTKECSNVRRDMKKALTHILRERLGGEDHPMWSEMLEKLHEEFGDLGSNDVRVGSNNNYIPKLGSPVTTGGFSISTSTSYTSADGRRVRVIHVRVPGADTGESYEIPASENTGIFVMGHKAFIGKMFFSDTPGTLVVLSGKRCLLKKYSGNESPKTVDITASEKCHQIRWEMRQVRGAVGSDTVSPIDTIHSDQNNQTLQNNRVAQQLSQVATALLDVVDQLFQTLGVNGQPNPFLAGLGNTLANITGFLNPNSEGRLENAIY